MKRLHFSCCLLVIVTLSHAYLSWSQTYGAPNGPVPRESQPPADVAVRLPVRLYGGYLLIAEGSIGNKHKLNFLVDTGACPSVIDEKIAHDLKLADHPGNVNLWSRSVRTREVVIPSLDLGPVRVESLPVLSEDLSFLQKAIGFKVHAIVGLDVLRKTSFTINYRTKEILFGSPEKLTSSVPFETDTPVVTIRMTFQDRQLRMVVDSGGPDLTLFRSRMRDSTGMQELGTETVTDAGGTFQRTKVRIPDLYIGTEIVGAQTAFVVDDRKDSGDDFDGVLGVSGLQFWKVAFDFQNRRFSWELPVARSPITAAGKSDPKANLDPVIKILVYNMAQAPGGTLTGAEHEASRILSAAGVRAIWFECSAGNSNDEVKETCQNGWGSINIGLRILVKPTAFANRIQGVPLGFTIHPALASIYYDHRLRFVGDDRGLGLPMILGCFMAHEIGHLLLGPNSHANQGLMQAGWGDRQIHQALAGDLLFTSNQAKLIQTEARVRMGLQTGTHAQSSSLKLRFRAPSPFTVENPTFARGQYEITEHARWMFGWRNRHDQAAFQLVESPHSRKAADAQVPPSVYNSTEAPSDTTRIEQEGQCRS